MGFKQLGLLPESFTELDNAALNGEITHERLFNILWSILPNLSVEDVARFFVSEVSEALAFLELCNGKDTCRNTSLLFNPHRLAIKTCSGSLSIYDAFKSPAAVRTLVKEIFLTFPDASLVNAFRSAVTRGFHGASFLFDFAPIWLVKFARRFLARGNVLDPCAGWGGRLIGAAALGLHYVGFEPATKTYNGLMRLAGWLKKLQPKFTYELYNMPFEQAEFSDFENRFSFAITSPPYWNVERYSDESTNACNLPSYRAFREQFFYPMVEKTLCWLKPGASFVLMLGDARYPIIRDFLLHFEHARLLGEAYTVAGVRRNAGDRFYVLAKEEV